MTAQENMLRATTNICGLTGSNVIHNYLLRHCRMTMMTVSHIHRRAVTTTIDRGPGRVASLPQQQSSVVEMSKSNLRRFPGTAAACVLYAARHITSGTRFPMHIILYYSICGSDNILYNITVHRPVRAQQHYIYLPADII